RAIGESKRLLHNVEFVVNFPDKLLDQVLHGDQPEYAAKFIHDDGHTNVATTQFRKQFPGWLRLRHDQDFPQHPAKIKRRWRWQLFLQPSLSIEQRPRHVFYVYKSQNVVFVPAINRDA